MSNKDILIKNLQSRVIGTRDIIHREIDKNKSIETNLQHLVSGTHGQSQGLYAMQLRFAQRRMGELETLYRSPFFAKVIYTQNGVNREVYISKHELVDNDVVSWTAPVAELRFADLGQAQLSLPENKIDHVNLNQKDSYVINEEKIIYYSQETKECGVEIIHEDFLANIKSEYGLSEIISKIEKEQYKIIQSDPLQPLIISGPAGSGKTTICLHRVAYLLQRPETADMYAGEKMLMLVQDRSTKSYFSSILPKLGIDNMQVDTYFDWAMSVIDIKDMIEINMYDIDEIYYKLLQNKLEIINDQKINKKKFERNIIDELDALYKKYLNKENYDTWIKNKNQNTLDYVDATLMLYICGDADGNIGLVDEHYKSLGDEKFKKVRRFNTIKYSMVIVDEYQNYSKDQIDIVRKVINSKIKSIVYIGDINQKSVLKPDSKINNYTFFDCKKVELNKVYRNTKQILEFIKSKGYKIEVPDKARSGVEVQVIKIENTSNPETNLVVKIKEVLATTSKEEAVGVLCDSQTTKGYITKEILLESDDKNIKVMTKIESQGTEFNTVISIDESENISITNDNTFNLKRKLAKKNANYISYTRAVERLVVMV